MASAEQIKILNAQNKNPEDYIKPSIIAALEERGYTYDKQESFDEMYVFTKDSGRIYPGNTTRYLEINAKTGAVDLYSQSNLNPSIIKDLTSRSWIEKLMRTNVTEDLTITNKKNS